MSKRKNVRRRQFHRYELRLIEMATRGGTLITESNVETVLPAATRQFTRDLMQLYGRDARIAEKSMQIPTEAELALLKKSLALVVSEQW